jgi:hypothetical protein
MATLDEVVWRLGRAKTTEELEEEFSLALGLAGADLCVVQQVMVAMRLVLEKGGGRS